MAEVFDKPFPDDARIVVTGGTSGIGAAVARRLAELGVRVTVTGRTTAELDAADLPASVNRAVVDLLEDPGALDTVISHEPYLDGLATFAGMIAREGMEFEPEGFEKVLSVNLTGTLRACRAARDKLEPRGGSIVTCASMLTWFGSATVPAYSASKGGVGQLTRSLAAAWASRGIRVNAVAPGWIQTDLTQALRDDQDKNRAILARTPMARWGQPEDIADPVVFLLSPAARFVTGAILPVDGGYSAN